MRICKPAMVAPLARETCRLVCGISSRWTSGPRTRWYHSGRLRQRIPNLLSLARLASAPLLFVLLWRGHWGWALWAIALAALTDALDGFLARRFDAKSRGGEVLDPIADKALLSGGFLALALS
ncbi:MAG: CDP-alcohol phosphatidyltransferase family protein, partial [Bryobacteraceae bacterium]